MAFGQTPYGLTPDFSRFGQASSSQFGPASGFGSQPLSSVAPNVIGSYGMRGYDLRGAQDAMQARQAAMGFVPGQAPAIDPAANAEQWNQVFQNMAAGAGTTYNGQPLNGGDATKSAPAGFVPGMAGPAGAPGGGNANPFTLGGLASGATSMPGVTQGTPGMDGYDVSIPGGASIPGGQPNYPLDIGSYLNPMMGYALKNGIDSINNSAAAAGSLNSGNTLKELMQFGLGVGANNFNNAANIAAGQQAFAHNVDVNDRDFAFNAGNTDFNNNLRVAQTLAGMGLSGGQLQSQNAQALARILAANNIAAGQMQAGGTQGSGNAIINMILGLLNGANANIATGNG